MRMACGRKQFLVSSGLFVLLICLIFSGCARIGREMGQEAAPLYIYVPQQLITSSNGGYDLPEGFEHPVVSDSSVYFLQGNSEVQAVCKAVYAQADERVGLDEAESLFAVSLSGFERNRDTEELSEEELFSMLDQVATVGEETVKPGNQLIQMEAGKVYLRFFITDYAIDKEENLYLMIECSMGSFYNMEYKGSILCKRMQDGKWAYRRYFANLDLQQDGFAVDGEGSVYLMTVEGIIGIDRMGQSAGMLKTETFKGQGFEMEKLYGMPNGMVFYFVYEDYGYRWHGRQVVQDGGMQLNELEGFSGNDYMDVCTAYGENLYYSSSMTGALCEYESKSAEIRERLLWSNSNLVGSCIRDFALLSQDEIFVWYDEPGMNGLYLLSRTPVEELPEKEPVVLASFESTTAMDNAVIRFNRQNKKYQVILESYGDSREEAEGAGARLDAALSSSNPPELISLSGRELDKDMEKGLLVDLLPYLENSSILKKDDFLENALEGYTFGEKLVGIPAEMTVYAVGGRASQLDEVSSWSMEDVYALTQQYSGLTSLLGAGRNQNLNTRKHLLEKFCAAYYLETFIDRENGTCHFDSEEFQKLLRWVDVYATEEEEVVGPGGRIFYTARYVPEDTLLIEGFLNFEEAARWNVLYDENIRLVGYPTADGAGKADISVAAPLGIVAGADNREGAWEFLEYYISSALQDTSGYSLPVSKSRLQKLMEDATRQNYVGEEPVKRSSVIVDGKSVPVYAIRPEMAQKLMEFLEEADYAPSSTIEDKVVSIILEETESYYRGDKSLDEVTGIIQNRVQLILDEQR